MLTSMTSSSAPPTHTSSALPWQQRGSAPCRGGLAVVPAFPAKLLHSLTAIYDVLWNGRQIAELLGLLGTGFGFGHAGQRVRAVNPLNLLSIYLSPSRPYRCFPVPPPYP